MGFFRRKKSAPLSISMYQGDNTTPARREGKLAAAAPLTPDTENASTDAPAAKSTKRGLFKSKPKERYVKVTPDKRDALAAAGASKQSQQENGHASERAALITPTKPSNNAGSDDCVPALVDDSETSIPALMTPDSQYKGLPPTPNDKDGTKRNLNSAFRDSSYQQEKTFKNNQDVLDSNDDTAQDKKLFRRLREWQQNRKGNSPNKTELKIMAQKLIGQQQKEATSSIPKVIDRSEEGSVPSLITEITGQSLRKTVMNSQQQPTTDRNSTNHTQAQTFFGPAESFSTTSKSNIQSSRQPRQELTIGEKFLSLLSCGQDTTSLDPGYFGRIKCLDLCGPIGERDELRLEREEEARFVVQFLNEISKQGIKLIYHKSPSSTDPSSDWTQLTIKLFLRFGSCHDNVHHPTLAWAILPVASRTLLTAPYENNVNVEALSDKNDQWDQWNYLSLWHIYSIMGAEDDTSNSPDSRSKNELSTMPSVDSNGDTYTRETASYTNTKGTTFDEDGTIPLSSSGFFSITASNDGNVHVFEAPSPSQRDYIVKGLKTLVRRASYQLIAGKLDICAELYGEDAAPLSGELPSLVTPTQALGRVTHSFLNEV